MKIIVNKRKFSSLKKKKLIVLFNKVLLKIHVYKNSKEIEVNKKELKELIKKDIEEIRKVWKQK